MRRSTPGWVLRHHAEDQLPNFPRQSIPADLFSHLRDHAPVHAKPSAVPTYDCLWANDNERLLPRRPKVASEHPEPFVDGSESGLRMLALQDSQLLPERQVLKEQPSAGTKAAGQQSYTQPREVKHGP